ncbi:MAG: flagellar biosynthesis protein FlhA [Myxococcota bacterium]|nr:flagellar biosynthesis protein FlhA [Myxococcota bacterium]
MDFQKLMQRGIKDAADYPLMIGMVSILALMILPLPPLILDLLLAINITISVLVMFTSLYVFKPLDFSVFPAMLLVTTLFRLGLNVASTRLILLGASNGQAEAGNIIKTFGQFVVGGSSVVGIVVFLILVIINFLVITKGAGRIAEVAARFTLDALPGKQMSIDGELANGALTETEARTKRDEVQREADFYGAMDGASKFVRGDAIAGLIITGINILGGLLIGVFQGGLTFFEAAQSYTVLTVGDGLVSQIPALLISTAAGVIVTRAASDKKLGDELGSQLLGNERVLYGAAGMLFLMGLIPGMPTLVFAALAAGSAWLGRNVGQATLRREQEEQVDLSPEPPKREEVGVQESIELEALTLEIGYELIHLVDEARGAMLLSRLHQARRAFAMDLGVVVPPIHIRDNLELSPGGYRLLVKGNPVGGSEMMRDRLLAIDPGDVYEEIQGVQTTDPTFNLPARWIASDDRYLAESAGYTVVEHEAVITTHLSELIRTHIDELVGWQELQERIDVLKEVAPKLVDELIPNVVKFGDILAVVRRLLRERVSTRDLRTILEAMAEHAPHTTSMVMLTDHVRARLNQQISGMFTSPDGVIYTAILDRSLEDRLRQCLVTQNNEPLLACDLTTAQGLFEQIEAVMGQFAARDSDVIILSPPDLRAPLHQFLSQFFPDLHVICHREIVPQAQIVSVGQLTLMDAGHHHALAG